MQLLKQNAAATVLVGPVLDSAGAAVTNAVIGDFQITKNGTSAAMASPATRTHSHNGFYLLSLATGDTDTVGRLVISVNNTAQSMSTHRYTVLLPSVFDALITNATNSTGGLPAATNTITALAGAISTFAGGAVASVTNRVTANVDQWGGVSVTGMPLPTDSYTAPDNATIGTISINLGTVNNNVLSRLAASSYIAPLSASETRSALGLASANLDTQLADIPTVTEFEARTLTTANYANSTNQTAIKSVTDKLNTGLVLDGAVYQFTANMLELAPGGGGGGSATIENQELILANLDNVTGAVSAAVARLQLETQITGFPATICRGSDYDQTLESEIRLQLLDLENNPITEIGGTPVAEITWLFGLGTDRQPRLVAGACSWDDTTDELVIELAAADTDTTPLGSVTWQIGAQIGELVRWLGGGTTRIVERQFAA